MYKWLFVSISCVCLMTDVHSLDEVLTQFTELFENVRNSHQLSSQEIQQAECLINEGRSYLHNPDAFFILPSFGNWVERLNNMVGDLQELSLTQAPLRYPASNIPDTESIPYGSGVSDQFWRQIDEAWEKQKNLWK